MSGPRIVFRQDPGPSFVVERRMGQPKPPGTGKAQERTDDGPLTPAEILDALENEGYPFELRVYKQLESWALEPFFGSRLAAGPDDTSVRETDVIASASLDIFRGTDTPAGLLDVMFVIEAKKIHKGAFVAFAADSGAPASVAEHVSTIGGWPSYGVLRAVDQNDFDLFFDRKDTLGSCFAPLVHDVPLCIQWSVPRRIPRDKHGRLFAADHPPGVADDLLGTMQTAAKLTHNSTFTTADAKVGLPFMTIALPVLVLDAPLYWYDVDDKTLEQTERLVLRVSGDTVLDRSDSRLVEIVTLDGLKQLVDAVNESLETAAAFFERTGSATNLAAIGLVQRERWQADRLRTIGPYAPYPR